MTGTFWDDSRVVRASQLITAASSYDSAASEDEYFALLLQRDCTLAQTLEQMFVSISYLGHSIDTNCR